MVARRLAEGVPLALEWNRPNLQTAEAGNVDLLRPRRTAGITDGGRLPCANLDHCVDKAKQEELRQGAMSSGDLVVGAALQP